MPTVREEEATDLGRSHRGHTSVEYRVAVEDFGPCRTGFRSGDLPPGRTLPSARLLSQQHDVAIGTVKRGRAAPLRAWSAP